jgi:hypothetical protein
VAVAAGSFAEDFSAAEAAAVTAGLDSAFVIRDDAAGDGADGLPAVWAAAVVAAAARAGGVNDAHVTRRAPTRAYVSSLKQRRKDTRTSRECGSLQHTAKCDHAGMGRQDLIGH